MGAKKNLIGQRFGRLTVIEECGRKRGGVLWLCKCDCGNETKVMSATLINGKTTSCGCYNRDVITKHNKSRSKLYHTYQCMVDRCTNPNSKEWERYGGRGITVCDEWLNDKSEFFDWALTHGYEEAERGRFTLDRIDNDGNYSPENCRWVDMKKQARNRRNNAVLEYKGEKHCLSEWAELLHENYSKLHSRYRRKWSVEEILFGRA